MELWQLWLLSTLDGWNSLFKGATVIFGMGSLFITFGYLIICNSNADHPIRIACKRLMFFFIPLFFIAAIGTATLPSSKQAWMIVGAYVATNIEGIDKLPKNTVKALNQFLEQYTEDN